MNSPAGLPWLKNNFLTLTIFGMLGLGMLCIGHPTLSKAAPHVIPIRQSSVVMAIPGQGRARGRARRARLLYLSSLLYQAFLLTAFFALGGSRWLAVLSARFQYWVPALMVVVVLCAVALAVLTFPLDYYRDFIFQHQYGLSNQTVGQWLRDYLLSGALSALFACPVVLLAYAVMRRSPQHWWLWVTVAVIPLSIFIMLITPVFITPLFNKFTPLRDEALRRDILTMANAHGIHADNVYEMDASRQSNAANAYVIGCGPTMRIVLYDTLVKQFTPDEVKFIMAHEMGHYVLGHIYQGILLTILGTLFASYGIYRLAGVLILHYGVHLGFSTISQPASFPLLLTMLFVFSLLAMPVSNAISRNFEWQADRFAVRNYPHPAAGISAFEKLAEINISEENPPRWAVLLFGTHPTLRQRIRALREYKTGNHHPWPIPDGGVM